MSATQAACQRFPCVRQNLSISFFFNLRLAPCFSVYFVLTNGCLIPLVAKIIRAMIILILQLTCELFSQLINLLTAQ